LSSTDALFTRFEGLFKKHLDSKQFLLLTLEQLGIDQASLRQLFYYSWDYGDAPSKQMLLEVLQITYPPGTEFWGSPAALEDHVLESFALALEELKFAEHTDSLPQEPQQKSKPGKPADPKIQKRRDIVRKHIHSPENFFEEDKKQALLKEFEENEIPTPKNRYGLVKYPGLGWGDIMSQPSKWIRVIDALNRGRFSRKKKTTTE